MRRLAIIPVLLLAGCASDKDAAPKPDRGFTEQQMEFERDAAKHSGSSAAAMLAQAQSNATATRDQNALDKAAAEDAAVQDFAKTMRDAKDFDPHK